MTVQGNVIWQGSDGKMSLQVNSEGVWLVSEQKNRKILLHEYPNLLTDTIKRILNFEDFASALLGKQPDLVAVDVSLKRNGEEILIQLFFQATGNRQWQHTLTFSEAYEFLNAIDKHWGLYTS